MLQSTVASHPKTLHRIPIPPRHSTHLQPEDGQRLGGHVLQLPRVDGVDDLTRVLQRHAPAHAVAAGIVVGVVGVCVGIGWDVWGKEEDLI